MGWIKNLIESYLHEDSYRTRQWVREIEIELLKRQIKTKITPIELKATVIYR